jgi:hypothetical protein
MYSRFIFPRNVGIEAAFSFDDDAIRDKYIRYALMVALTLDDHSGQL